MRLTPILPCLFGINFGHAANEPYFGVGEGQMLPYTCRKGVLEALDYTAGVWDQVSFVKINDLRRYAADLKTVLRVYAIDTGPGNGWMSYIEVWYATGAVTETGESAQPVKVLYKYESEKVATEKVATEDVLQALCPQGIRNIIPAGIPDGWSEADDVTVVLKTTVKGTWHGKSLVGTQMTVPKIYEALIDQGSCRFTNTNKDEVDVRHVELWLAVKHADSSTTDVDLLSPDYKTDASNVSFKFWAANLSPVSKH